MKISPIILITTVLLLTAGCDDGKQAGDDAVRNLTGANTITQGQQMKEKLKAAEALQQQKQQLADQQ